MPGKAEKAEWAGRDNAEVKVKDGVLLCRVLLICGIQDIRFHSRLYSSIIIPGRTGGESIGICVQWSPEDYGGQKKILVENKINI